MSHMPFPHPFLAPMQATSGPLPSDPGWAFELKWDGMRLLACADHSQLRLCSRSGVDVTTTFPELASLSEHLGAGIDGPTLLDGEVVAFSDGRPSFSTLQHRIHLANPSADQRRAVPVTYMIFDLLVLAGRPVHGLPYSTRRHLLQELVENDQLWSVPNHSVDDSAPLTTLAETTGLEGLVAKRLSSIYKPGRRSTSWVKSKNVQRQEFVIGGWLEGDGDLRGKIGSLMVGVWDGGALTYVGAVGSGLTEDSRTLLQSALTVVATCPFAEIPKTAKTPTWALSTMAVEVEFLNWSSGGNLRHPTFKGLRNDKDPKTITREYD